LKKNTMIICLGLVAALAAACLTGAAAAAQGAQSYTHQESGVTFDVPAGWKAEPDGEQLTVSSADETVALVFWVPTEGTFDAAVAALDEELAKTIKNMKADGEVKVDTHNGMRHAGQSGTGEMDGKSVLWSVDMLQAKKPVIILTFAAPEDIKKHEDEYGKLVKSIRKAE
jgi:predicted Zn-dependent protease